MRMFVSIALLLGLTWIFAAVVVANGSTAALVLFILFNSLQGLTLLVMNATSSQVTAAWKKKRATDSAWNFKLTSTTAVSSSKHKSMQMSQITHGDSTVVSIDTSMMARVISPGGHVHVAERMETEIPNLDFN